jgi:7-cyano-7-deazaguanine synthase
MADDLEVLDIVKNRTLTCYNGIPTEGCGECPACKLRKKGLDEFYKSCKVKTQF